MSVEIPVAFVQQYSANVMHLAQQSPSKFRSYVRIKDNLVGKTAFFERIGATAAVKRTSRHADTPLISTPHSRRRVALEDWEWADLVDKQDEVRLLIDPASEYVINASKAMNRTVDDLVIAALGGSAYSIDENDAATAVALPAAQKVAVGGTGLTIAKLRTAKRILDAADVEAEDRAIAISPIGLEDLLATTEVTSSDFNTVKALVQGQLDTFLGFKFIVSTRLPFITGTVRAAYAWSKPGMGLAIGKDVQHEISVRPDKSYTTQVYFCLTMQATRVEDARVVEIAFDEAV